MWTINTWKQLFQAPGWKVVHVDDDGKKTIRPLFCFAIAVRNWFDSATGGFDLERGDESVIVPVDLCYDGTTEDPTTDDNFVTLLGPGEPEDAKWIDEACQRTLVSMKVKEAKRAEIRKAFKSSKP